MKYEVYKQHKNIYNVVYNLHKSSGARSGQDLSATNMSPLRGHTSLHSHYLHCHCDPAKREWQSFLRGHTSLHSHYLYCHCDPAKREWQSFFLVFTFVFCLSSFVLFCPVLCALRPVLSSAFRHLTTRSSSWQSRCIVFYILVRNA
jgi:hypothetical protein